MRIHKIEVHQNFIILEVNDKLVDLAEVKLFWYRRSTLNHPFLYMIDQYPLEINRQVHNFLDHEWAVCRNYVIYMMEQKKTIGGYFRTTANKLINLKIAHECGLNIPRTYISDSPKVLNKLGEYPSITKPIGEAMPVMEDEGYHSLLTKVFDNGSWGKGLTRSLQGKRSVLPAGKESIGIMTTETDKIELRSHEIRDMLTCPPHSLTPYGILVI